MQNMPRIFTLAFLLLLFRQFILVKLCEPGATNETIQVTCMKTVTVTKTRYYSERIEPNCNWLWNIFSKRCNTRYRKVPSEVNVTKEELGQCNSTRCCDEYVMSANTCVHGCRNGTYGENCTLSCTCPADAYPQCDKDSGNCTCLPGLMGNNCTEPCQDGNYGDNCRYSCNCHGNASCDAETGYCNCTVPGWTGTYCDLECNGTFGLNCSEACNCNENQTCDPVNGTCNCKPGRRGTNCSNECDEWTYGVDCQYNCSCDINTTKLCDQEIGKCQCFPGFEGQNCSDFCQMGFYGDGCTEPCSCYGTTYCDHINGTCICLGKKGENCTADCEDGLFGPDCTMMCNCSGENYDETCHPYNGTCFCKTGWSGDNCSFNDTKDDHTEAQVNTSPKEEALANTTPKEEGLLKSDLLIAIIAGCCGIVVIIIIIICVCVLRRRKQKCFDRQNLKQYNNAAYSEHIASDAQVIKGLEKQHNNADELDKIIVKNEDGDTAAVDHVHKNEMETPTNCDNDVEMENENNSKNNMPENNFKTSLSLNTDTVDKISMSKHQVLQEMHIAQKITEGNSDILPDVENDENSDHYSDIDSLKDEKEQRYSFVEIEKNDSLDELISGQEFPEEEQYDSLENDTVKKLVILPNYSSFEEVCKETLNENQVDTDDPYDKLFLANQNKKKTLTRNDYNKFNFTDKTIEEDLNKDIHGTLSGATKETKSSLPSLSKNIKSEQVRHESEIDDTEYNLLDHTGKSFQVSNTPDNIYHTREMLKNETNTTLDAESNVEVDSDKKINPPNEAQQETDVVLIEEPEYNKLDHTGKSFRAAEVPENVYDTNRIESASNNPVRKMSRLKKQTSIEGENFETQNSGANNTDISDDSEYNCLDHTGKSFRRVNIPDNIYHNKTDPSKLGSNISVSPVDINVSHNIGEEEEDSYSFCEIDDVDNEQGETPVTDDDAFIYEIPETSHDELNESDSHGTSEDDEKLASKSKRKAKQRQIDDYEHYDLTFGNSPS